MGRTQMAESETTVVLEAVERGDPDASARLLPLVYEELRSLAERRMRRESADHTLQPTALVHEAFARLVGSGNQRMWTSRLHFFAAAAEAMRRILIENARRKRSVKYGGGLARRELNDEALSSDLGDQNRLLLVDDALTALALTDPKTACLVEMRFFGGMTIEEAAEVLGISPRTAKRNWTYARAWLRREMNQHANG